MRVCIVYEHSLFAHGLKGLLEQDKTLRMVGMFERPRVSLPALRRLKPDVVVVEGDGEMSILESLDDARGVGVNLRSDEATIFTCSSVRVSKPEDLVATIATLVQRKKRPRPGRSTPGGHGRSAR